MKTFSTYLCLILLLLATACQRRSTVCPPESIVYFDPTNPLPTPTVIETMREGSSPVTLEIGGRMREVDRVIHGPVCNDTWNGTVYVACDIQIAAWVEAPRFFEGCALTIEPGSTVYVAAHNDTAYYKGCSCHTESTTNR